MSDTIIGAAILWAFFTGVAALTLAYLAALWLATDWMWRRSTPAVRKAFMREYIYNRRKYLEDDNELGEGSNQ